MYRAIVVDDEIAAVGRLIDLLQESGIVSIVDGYTNPLEALKQTLTGKRHHDLAFLDIDMPGMNGITLAKHILERRKNIQIIFVTAYPEYALKAYELNALDYIIKPVTKERLKKTLNRLS